MVESEEKGRERIRVREIYRERIGGQNIGLRDGCYLDVENWRQDSFYSAVVKSRVEMFGRKVFYSNYLNFEGRDVIEKLKTIEYPDIIRVDQIYVKTSYSPKARFPVAFPVVLNFWTREEMEFYQGQSERFCHYFKNIYKKTDYDYYTEEKLAIEQEVNEKIAREMFLKEMPDFDDI